MHNLCFIEVTFISYHCGNILFFIDIFYQKHKDQIFNICYRFILITKQF